MSVVPVVYHIWTQLEICRILLHVPSCPKGQSSEDYYL
jgi:hypothetical protein